MFLFCESRKLRIVSKGLITAYTMLSLSACAQSDLKPNLKDGESKSAICGQCHGKDGIAIIPIYPNLAGQKQAYMELQLKAFRKGERINAAMTPHARKLSDQDIVDLSAYYASMNPQGSRNNKQ